MSKYDDIISVSHPEDLPRPRMSRLARAAQFSPFAALSGFDTMIDETSQSTEAWVPVDDLILAELDKKMRWISSHLEDRVYVTFIYFDPYEEKKGKKYKEVCGIVHKIDYLQRVISLYDDNGIRCGNSVKMDQITDILCDAYME